MDQTLDALTLEGDSSVKAWSHSLMVS